MLSAFAARPIVELKPRDKSKIESVLALGDRVFVGLNTGALKIYTLKYNHNSKDISEDGHDSISETGKEQQNVTVVHAGLLRDLERFSRKSIQQLAIFQDASVLISLADGYVSFHDLETYALSERLDATKGATSFATIRNIIHDSETGIASIVSRLAVVVRRKLLVWTWQDMELVSSAQEVSCPATIKCLTWATNSKVLIGMDPGFSIVDVDTAEITDVNRPSETNEEAPTGFVRFGAVNASGMGYIGMSSWVPTPMATTLTNDQLLLAKDVNSLFIDSSGNSLERRQVPWTAPPDSIGYSYPYMLSLQSPGKGRLDVRNPHTLSLLQSISLPNASILHVPHPNISLAHAGKGFLVASERCIWQMDAIGYGSQVDELLLSNYFDEALSLLDLIEDTLMLDKFERIREVKTRKALYLFTKSSFRESLELFSEAQTRPSLVISLYPESVAGSLSRITPKKQQDVESDIDGDPSGEQQNSSSAHDKVSNDINSTSDVEVAHIWNRSAIPLEGKKMTNAVNELWAFLVQTRTNLQKYLDFDGNLKPAYQAWQETSEPQDQLGERPPFANFLDFDHSRTDIDWRRKLIEVFTLVDTTLFRAGMVNRPSLAGSLFRSNNFCSADVVEEKLHENGRYSELIDFLRGKKLHVEALNLLEKLGKSDSADDNLAGFRGPRKTIQYLQQLPFEQVDLILQYALWPMQIDPENAMEIFTADTDNAEALPRDRVLDFLQSLPPNLTIQYLEHIIYELHDTTTKFHDQLAHLYLAQLQDTKEPQQASLQQKLETLLKSSNDFSKKGILKLLPQDDERFYESRAIVLRKLARHEEALGIYVYKLEDFKRAENYCNQVYLATTAMDSKVDPDATPSIYTTLLSLYLKPPAPKEPQLEPALQLLSIHGSRLPALETLEALPLSIPIKDLEDYFKTRMRAAMTVAREEAVLASLRRVDKTVAEADLLLGVPWDAHGEKNDIAAGKSRKVVLSENRFCPVCNKRFGRAAARLWPDGRVVHYGCSERLK